MLLPVLIIFLISSNSLELAIYPLIVVFLLTLLS